MDSTSPSSSRPASFLTQTNAFLRKNLVFQIRNRKLTIRIIIYPVIICVLLSVLQRAINSELDSPKYKCGCRCVDMNGNGSCENVCGIQYSTSDQADSCAIPNPKEWPALLQVPRPEYRAAKVDFSTFTDLPDKSCRDAQSCPAAVLLTGGNRSLVDSLAPNLFTSSSPSNLSNYLSTLSKFIAGTDTVTRETEFIEPAFFSDRPVYIVQPECRQNSTLTIPIQIDTATFQQELKCVQALPLWRQSSSEINDELFNGYRLGNTERVINEIMGAYDFLNSNEKSFNVIFWYNSTYKNASSMRGTPPALVRVSRSLNVVSNAYLQFVKGADVKMQLEFTKEMPKPANQLSLDFSSLLSALFFQWIVELLFPVMLIYLVYEKQHKLRIMMKMHGLGDGPYWIISYVYFLFLSSAYVLSFVILGSVIGLKFFTLNDYSIQFVFYFTSINLQIVLAFLTAASFSNARTAEVTGYLYIFGSGIVAGYLLRFFIEDTSFPRKWLLVMEIIPAFSLYRGLYEFSQYSFNGDQMGTSGMRWGDLNDSLNGMRDVLTIIVIEWLVLLPVAYYLNQGASLGSRISNNPLFSLQRFLMNSPSNRRLNIRRQGSKEVSVDMEKPDIIKETCLSFHAIACQVCKNKVNMLAGFDQHMDGVIVERNMVEQLLLEPDTSYAIICDNLKKVYPGKDGNQDKFAVQGLSLALPHGECFGLLGPNGAGKTTFINMMIGLIAPTSGNAFVRGFNIQNDMDKIYGNMSVCPQNDMLWEMLTGREHLLFYGRLKNLKGSALMLTVEESLKSVNLFHGGVADKQVKKYSGGMKRRLSVAISLIGDPKVVYMDEPSTGLDPASRKKLWNVLKQAKQNRATILTTHSMEEAEFLCDRLGIFVDGSLQCIGNPRELKARYGESYIFTMTTSPEDEHKVENLVFTQSPNAKKIYQISGTQKFEMPKQEVRIADVFSAVSNFKSKVTVQAWGLADTTMEDVFIKVAKRAELLDKLS